MTKDHFTESEVETALCAWEHIKDLSFSDDPAHIAWVRLRENMGAADLRHACISLGRWVFGVYEACNSLDPYIFEDKAYDWDVVPRILADARDIETGEISTNVHRLPSAADTAERIVEAILETGWLNNARREAERQWGLGELVEDHWHRLIKFQDDGLSPAEAVARLGRALSLTPGMSFK